MASFSKFNSHYKIRSISLPCRSHPSTSRIEVELNKIKSQKEAPSTSSTPSSKHIINDIPTLKELYKSIEELLRLQTTKIALSRCTRFVDDMQDIFISLLDISVASMEMVSRVKEHIRDIQSSLRRRKDDSQIESIVSKNTCFRKKTTKNAKILISKLKQMEIKFATLSFFEQDRHVSSVIRSLREVVGVTIEVFNSICLLLCAPILLPKTRWSAVSKLLQKGGVVACENQLEDLNELQSLDMALDLLCRSDSRELGDCQKIEVAKNSLKSFEISIIEIEGELEFLFRGLIRVKTSLLNIGSSFV